MFNKELYDRFISDRQELNNLYTKIKDYKTCLQKTKEFENMLISNNIHDDYNFHFLNMMYSKTYLKLNNITLAIKHGKLAEKYSYDDSLKACAYWGLANSYFNINKSKTIFYYRLCENYYKEIGELFYYAQVRCNIAELLFDEKMLLNTIELYSRITDYSKYSYTVEDIDDMNYSSLFNIYLYGHSKNRLEKAWNVLHKIKDKNLKQTLSNLLLSSQMVG